MTRYYLHLVNPSEATAQVYECGQKNALVALDDALRAAKILAFAGDVEVWSEQHRIAVVKKGNRPCGLDSAAMETAE